MDIKLNYYEKDGVFTGVFDYNMDGVKIEASSTEFLIDIAKKKCENKFGKEKMFRTSLIVNRIRVLKDA